MKHWESSERQITNQITNQMKNWPALVINLKQHILGKEVIGYVKRAEEVAAMFQQPLIICPSHVDLAFSALVKRKHTFIFSQSYDFVQKGGSDTGGICPNSLVSAGAEGSLLNHYEKRIYGLKPGKDNRLRDSSADFQRLFELIKIGNKEKLRLIVCADQAETAAKIVSEVTKLSLQDISIAVEWDDYIGNGTSIVEGKPEMISRTIMLVKMINSEIPVYCGAGVQGSDVKRAIEQFGVQGALIATYCTKAPDFAGDYEKAIKVVLEGL